MKAVQIEVAGSAENSRAGVRLGDFVLILLGGLLLVGLVLVGERNPIWGGYTAPLRISLGLIYIFYIPGYLLQAGLFSRHEDLDGIERTGLSLGLSVALVPVLALILDRLPWGLRLWPIVIGQALMILLLAFIAGWRRWSVGAEVAYSPDLHVHPGDWWRGLGIADRRLYLLAAGALLFAGLVAAWVFWVPSPDEFMTEFYMLGKDWLAEDFPRQAQVGEPLSVTVGIHNLERATHVYRVEAWAVDPWDEDRRELVASSETVPLAREAEIEWPLLWNMSWAGDDQQVEFFLYIDDQPEPYRRLVLWLNVSE